MKDSKTKETKRSTHTHTQPLGRRKGAKGNNAISIRAYRIWRSGLVSLTFSDPKCVNLDFAQAQKVRYVTWVWPYLSVCGGVFLCKNTGQLRWPKIGHLLFKSQTGCQVTCLGSLDQIHDQVFLCFHYAANSSRKTFFFQRKKNRRWSLAVWNKVHIYPIRLCHPRTFLSF